MNDKPLDVLWCERVEEEAGLSMPDLLEHLIESRAEFGEEMGD